MVEPSDRRAASSLHRDRELEVSVRTVRLEELLAILRRHVRLVVGVVLATVAAAGVVAYVTGPAYRAVAVIRMSDPRRALTGGVVLDPARADERFSDPLLSQAELLTSRAVAGAVVASAPAPTGRGRRWRVSRPDWRESNCSVSNSRQSDVPTRVS